MTQIPFWAQLINLLAAVLLLLAFAMLAQRRVLTLINLFAAQGFALASSTAIVAFATHQPHLYWSVGLTLVLKVMLLPWLLHRLILKLDVKWDVEGLINIPTTMLLGIVLVVFAFNLALPISQLANTVTRATLGIAMASVAAVHTPGVPETNQPSKSSSNDATGTRLLRRLSKIRQRLMMDRGFGVRRPSRPGTRGRIQRAICQSPRVQRCCRRTKLP